MRPYPLAVPTSKLWPVHWRMTTSSRSSSRKAWGKKTARTSSTGVSSTRTVRRFRSNLRKEKTVAINADKQINYSSIYLSFHFSSSSATGTGLFAYHAYTTRLCVTERLIPWDPLSPNSNLIISLEKKANRMCQRRTFLNQFYNVICRFSYYKNDERLSIKKKNETHWENQSARLPNFSLQDLHTALLLPQGWLHSILAAPSASDACTWRFPLEMKEKVITVVKRQLSSSAEDCTLLLFVLLSPHFSRPHDGNQNGSRAHLCGYPGDQRIAKVLTQRKS